MQYVYDVLHICTLEAYFINWCQPNKFNKKIKYKKNLKSQSLLEDLTGQIDLTLPKFTSERCLVVFVHFESNPWNHSFLEPEGNYKTIRPLPSVTDHGTGLFISGPIQSSTMVLIYDIATSLKTIFSLYLLLILTLGKSSYYPSSPAKMRYLGVKYPLVMLRLQE